MAFKWLKQLTRISTDDSTERAEQEVLNRAMAVLMLEIAQSDFSESAPETQTIKTLLETYHSQEGNSKCAFSTHNTFETTFF